jgi:hypothetical protein
VRESWCNIKEAVLQEEREARDGPEEREPRHRRPSQRQEEHEEEEEASLV